MSLSRACPGERRPLEDASKGRGLSVAARFGAQRTGAKSQRAQKKARSKFGPGRFVPSTSVMVKAEPSNWSCFVSIRVYPPRSRASEWSQSRWFEILPPASRGRVAQDAVRQEVAVHLAAVH